MKRGAPKPTQSERLIIFCRFPYPGKAKTRLIPGVGAAKAALIHKELAEFTLDTAKVIAEDLDLSIEIAIVGNTLEPMKEWLGDDLLYTTQVEGDLGLKMSNVITKAFQQNCKKVIIIGTDCPEITPSILEDAFSSLDNHELVIGPAYDGGYYLIGLNREIPKIFEQVSWGSEHVFKETMKQCSKDKINLHLLRKLHDIDRPEDLHLWTQIKK